MQKRQKLPDNSRTKKGFYTVVNHDKYVGDLTNVFFRSSWEYKFMVYCDLKPGIIKWGSEIFKIPYTDYLGHYHNYIPDFYLETRDNTDPLKLNKFLVEIKPEKETKEPVIPTNISEKKLKSLEWEIKTWQKNKYKWVFAKEWCNARDITFWLVTEKHLDLFKL